MRRVADPGEHEQLRRLQSAATDDDFARRGHALQLVAALIFGAGRAAILHEDAARCGAGYDMQIRPRQIRVDIGARRRASLAILLRHLIGADALLSFAVEVAG